MSTLRRTLALTGATGLALAAAVAASPGASAATSHHAHGDRVFVLNARGGGSIQGYLDLGGRLFRVPSWHRELNLPVTPETSTAEFTHTPGQVAFTPDGRHLVVTTKASTNSILVYFLG